MFKVNFSIPGVAVAISNPLLQLVKVDHDIEVELNDGHHVFTSQDFELGSAHTVAGRRPITGRLTFGYSYDAMRQLITVCGSDYPSAKGMALITTQQGTGSTCIEHAAAVGFPADEVPRNNVWNYRTQLMQGAAQVFKSIARSANEALITALEQAPGIRVRVRKELQEMPLEHYHNLCPVYRDDHFLEWYDPTHRYEPNDRIGNLESSITGTETWAAEEDFANAKGTSGDPYPLHKPAYTSWIEVWSAVTGQNQPNTDQCVSKGFLSGKAFQCDGIIVGGHVIPGTEPETLQPKDTVCLVPICHDHNMKYGTGDFMQVSKAIYAQGVPVVTMSYRN